jgi:hypothetical protein
MFTFEKSHTSTTETSANLDKMGIVPMSEMKATPFFAVYHKGHHLKINDNRLCSETGGVCLDFINKYLKIEWKTGHDFVVGPYEFNQ